MIDLPEFMEPLRRIGNGFPEEAVRETLRRKEEIRPKKNYRLIESSIDEMSGWDCFRERNEDGGDEDYFLREAEWVPPLGGFPHPGTVVRDSPKIGRNEPCPCGSGKKFKKCCGKAGG